MILNNKRETMKTKHLIIATVASIVLISSSATAQISVGTRQGITFSTLSEIGDIYGNDHISTSYTGGVFAVIPVKGAFSFAPEVNYIRKGRGTEPGASNFDDASTHFNYLQVPMMARYKSALSNSDKYLIYFNAGPYAALLLKSKTKAAGSSEWIDDNYDSSEKDPDFGIVVGAGIMVPVSKVKLQFDLRYDMGLSKLNNQPQDYKTKAVSLAAGIMF